MLICGASFAGLAVARELAGSGADVLIVDRYEIGERQTSACGIPTEWLRAPGPDGLPSASASTRWSSTPPTATPATGCPGPSPPSTTASSARCSGSSATPASRPPRSRAARAPRQRRRRDRGRDRPRHRSPRRWSSTRSAGAACWPAGDGYQPPDAPLSRGLEVHPGRRRRGPRDLDRPPLCPRRLRLVLPGRRGDPDRRRLLRPDVPRARDDRAAGRGPGARPRPLPGQLDPPQAAPRRPSAASSSSATRPATACR